MIVQHNLSAINANRQIGITSGNLSKTTEKLASGYKVNRAADDASGLAISEKMRRQIRGLSQASMNVSDGISFVQVADGALAEVHDMLQRCNELSVKAANGTLTKQDRAYIDTEYQHLKEEIDRIGETTTFNEFRVFPENGSAAHEASAAEKALAEEIAKQYVPNAVKQIVSKLNGSLGNALHTLSESGTTDLEMELDVSYIDGPSNTLAYVSAGFYQGNSYKDSFATGSLKMKVDSADFTTVTDNLTTDEQIELKSTIAHELMHGVMDVLLPEGMYNNDTGDDPYGNFPKWFKEGTAQLVGGGFTTGWNNWLMNIANSSITDKLTSVQNGLKNYTVEERVYGHGYIACAYLCQLASGQSSVNQDSLIAGANAIFNALMQNEDQFKNASFENTVSSLLGGLTVADVVNNINNGEQNAAQFALDLANASSGGAGSIIADGGLNDPDAIDSLNEIGDQEIYIGSTTASSYSSDAATLKIQAGSESDESNIIPVKRFALSQAAIGIYSADVLTEESARASIDAVKHSMKSISTMRSYYGSTQNRMEHARKNLDNTVENTQSAESLIRDTDMAIEMVRYSNLNIILQSGQSLLAQANSSLKDVLNVLQ